MRGQRASTRAGCAALVVGVIALVGCVPVRSSPPPPPPPPPDPTSALQRPADPVVVAGRRVPSLLGTPVGAVVAFVHTGVAWEQIPVQVDERVHVELNTVYHAAPNVVNPFMATLYADADTWVGPGDGVLSSLDEIAFLAVDVGAKAPDATPPAGVVPDSGVQLVVTDPTAAGAGGWVYLFESAGGLDPGAGGHGVTYDFVLASGDYKTTYSLGGGPNPESSVVTTPSYTRHFGDRWLDDGLTITTPGATAVDILDRHKNLFVPGYCGRSEDTFNAGPGAFIANTSGPVRAIRSYLGANSGTYTARTHLYYPGREDIVTDLRVHAIPAILDFFDYDPAAIGMTYSNDRNVGGVTIDGVPDALVPGFPTWEKVDGAPGSLTIVRKLHTDASVGRTNYYDDDATPATIQCTGDGAAYGASGQWINTAIPNTDWHVGLASFLSERLSLYFEAPGRSVAEAQAHSAHARNPLASYASAWPGP